MFNIGKRRAIVIIFHICNICHIMEPIRTFAREHFSSSCAETIERREEFENFLFNALPTENDIPASYLFTKVRGDRNCFFHAILRY